MIEVRPVWFDSLGAKSSCTLVKTPDVNILIDPGVAIMHSSFPASPEDKVRWVGEGREEIRRAAEEADVVVISHYHYDHFTDFDKALYEGKIIFAKNPNQYINDSQRKRALRFYSNLFEAFGLNLEEMVLEPIDGGWRDIIDDLRHALSLDYGDYWSRKVELLEKGRKWFENRRDKWRTYHRIPEINTENYSLYFAEGKSFKFGETRISFKGPLFHGIEYSRVGWVFSTVIEYGGYKIVHTSDLNGPIIEDYADWIIEEQPNIIILDGPMTYMLGYMLNRINLRRAIENARRIVEEVDFDLMIYDHHLPREPRFRERTSIIWRTAEDLNKKVLTAAEYLGRKPVVLM